MKITSIVSVIVLFGTANLVAAPSQNLPASGALVVEEVTVEAPSVVHFKLSNISNQPITAWEVTVSGTIGGKRVKSIFGRDLALSSWLDDYRRNPVAQGPKERLSGDLMPGDFQRDSVPLFGKETESEQLEDASVTVMSVLFADFSSAGDPVYANMVLQDREKDKLKRAAVLEQLRSLEEEGDPLGAMVRLEGRLTEELNWPEGTPQPIIREEQSAQMGLLTELRFSLRVLKGRSNLSPADAFAALIERLKLKHDALEKHTPIHH